MGIVSERQPTPLSHQENFPGIRFIRKGGSSFDIIVMPIANDEMVVYRQCV